MSTAHEQDVTSRTWLERAPSTDVECLLTEVCVCFRKTYCLDEIGEDDVISETQKSDVVTHPAFVVLRMLNDALQDEDVNEEEDGVWKRVKENSR